MKNILLRCLSLIALAACETAFAQALVEVPPGGRVEMIKPSKTDPAIRRFDDPHVVMTSAKVAPDAPLVVFMSGTGGKPAFTTKIVAAAAAEGNRAIGLAYDDTPAVVETCKDDPDPDCSENFRAERVFGGDASKTIDNSDAESVQNRLAKLLQFLDKRHPDAGWSGYLEDGAPRWGRLIVTGISQGAGMAAFIGKKKRVDRVVLFSGPWDFLAKDKKGRLAPWLAEAAATPSERWFAAYHQREAAAPLIAKSLALLKVPADHIRVFNADPASGRKDPPAFHGDAIRNPAYGEDWKFLFGKDR